MRLYGVSRADSQDDPKIAQYNRERSLPWSSLRGGDEAGRRVLV